VNRFRSPAYLDYVRSLPCCSCGKTSGIEAHHIKGRGHLSGAGLTAPDTWAMPLCGECHSRVHLFSDMADCQFEWVARTLAGFIEGMFALRDIEIIKELNKHDWRLY
jgi:hypothetical protein